MRKKMKKTIFIVLALLMLPLASFGEIDATRFERKKVAIIPYEDDLQFTQMIEAALGRDKRFAFIDKSKIPEIVKEMARRQSGITEKDDTENLVLKNIDYLVSLENIVFNSYVSSISKTATEGSGENKETYTYTVYQMETSIKGNLKVVNVKKGGEVNLSSVSGRGSSGEAKSRYAARKLKGQSKMRAINSFRTRLSYVLKKMFPIEAPIYAQKYRTIKLGRGSNSGIKYGQRFMLTQEQKVKLPHKTITEKNEIAYIQVSKVMKDNAVANIIFSNDNVDPNKTTAVEKLFSEISIDLLGSFRQYQGNLTPHLGIFNGGGGLRAWVGFLGGTLETGLGAYFSGAGSDIYNFTADWAIRGNINLVRRLFLYVNLGFTFEYSWMNRTLDLDGTSYSLGIGSFGMGFNIGAGFKFVITENIYALVGYEYTFSLIGHGTWNLQDAGEDGGSPKDQDIYNKQGTNYNDFSDNFNFDGMKIIFGVGFLF
jgi:hypothetical protein